MSTWYPIGPDFVYALRDPLPAKRLSRRNEWGRQAKVNALTVDPSTLPPRLYTIEAPYPQARDDYDHSEPQRPYWPIGASVFRSDDDGRSWTPIADSLIQATPSLVPTCIATHPLQSNNVYLGTASGTVHLSTTHGDDWSTSQNLGAAIRQIVVDPRNAANPATTTLYAATATGLQRSLDGGGTWQPTSLVGDVTTLAFHMPAAGTAHLYAGVYQTGLFHATDAAGAWTNLSGSGSGLPAHAGSNFDGVYVDFARQNPSRVYVVLGSLGGSFTLYATAAAPSGFAPVPGAAQPQADLYRNAFAVTPNSPGDGTNDVLLFTGVDLFRSNNGGASWDICADDPHGDHNCIGFSTLAPAPGTIPTTYIGSDGGLFVSTSVADGTTPVTVAPSDFSDGSVYTASGVAQNYEHGKLSLAVAAYASDAASGAMGYAASQDTGLAGHVGTLGWRGLDANSDAWGVAATQGADGLKVWYYTPFDTHVITDHGETYPTPTPISTGAPQSSGSGTSTMRVDVSGRCLSGLYSITALQSPVNAGAGQVATPYSMLGIVPNMLVRLGQNDFVTVSSVTATTFTADFPSGYAAGTPVKAFGGVVVRIDQAGAATQVSQAFGTDRVKAVATHPTDDQFAACVTGKQQWPPDQRVWMTSGAPLGPGTVWQEIAGPTKPSGGLLSSLAIDGSGKVYVVLTDLTWTKPGGGAVTTPLYEVSTGSWLPQPCVGLPAGRYGSIVVRPGSTNTLYISCGAQVYEVVLSGGTWTWTPIGPGLPGQPIVDVWVGDVGDALHPKMLVRAAVVTRGVWEADVTSGPMTADPPTRPYFRHHALDQGWLTPSIEGQVDPFNAAIGPSLYHWESPDIKIDAQRPASGGQAAYFQNDPEEPLPLSHVAFDRLIDNSQNLPQSDAALVHVQVHNRSYTPIDGVAVWAIWCRPSGGVPSLAADGGGNTFDFWGQFHTDGTIVPGLPPLSPWKSVAPPTTLAGIDAAHPRIASFTGWNVPTLGPGDPGHYCMVAFAHSQAYPINETNPIVDAIATSNPQVAQRNLHVTTMVPFADPAPGGYGFWDYIEIHNPTGRWLTGDLVFDLRALPKGIHGLVQLTHLRTPPPRDRTHVEKPTIKTHPGLPWLKQGSRHFESLAVRRLVLAPKLYTMHPAAAFEARGIRLEPFGAAAALFALATTDKKLLAHDHRFRILHRVDGRVIGGSTYWIRASYLPHEERQRD